MSKEHKLIPELRFPEFLNEGEWVEEKLGDIAENLDSKRIPITSNQREKGNIPYYGASGIIDFVKDYIYDEELLCISEDGANLVDRNYPIAFTIRGKTWVNNHAHVLKFENASTRILIEKYINSINVEHFLTGAAQPKLNRGKLDVIPVPLSKNPQEQQKIASCLSSLDEVISAQSQKLELLKDHKKGLMQNLFPQMLESQIKTDERIEQISDSSNKKIREISKSDKIRDSDNVPKYRFKEFEKDGDWVEKKLGEVCKMQAGKFVSASEIKEQLAKDLYPCYGGNGLRGYTKSYTHTGTYSLIGRQGALCGNITLVEGNFHATEHAVVVMPETIVDTIWLYYELELLDLNQYATGQAQPGLSVSNLEQVKLYAPENLKEQRKIASCLSSLDALITAQVEKIAQLKLHKKGLMLGLFPKMNE